MKRRHKIFFGWLWILFFLSSGLGASLSQATSKTRTRGELIIHLKNEIVKELQANDFQGVIAEYQHFVDLNRGEYIPLMIRGYYSEALANAGKIDEAGQVLQKMIEEVPPQMDFLKMQYNLANLLFMQNRQKEARALYEMVVLTDKKHDEFVGKARERLAKMKEKEVRHKDKVALELYDVETILETGEIPVGVEEYLQGIVDRGGDDKNADKAKALLDRIKEIKDNQARVTLNEARRLFDEEKKYAEVREMLESILQDYPNTSERQSIETLLKEVELRLPRRAR